MHLAVRNLPINPQYSLKFLLTDWASAAASAGREIFLYIVLFGGPAH